jgi:penicillin-binding protein 1A
MRRLPPGVVGAAILLAGVIGLRLAAGAVERSVTARIETAAARLGARAHADDVRVSLWPPLRLDGLVVERPGQWQLHVDRTSVTLRPWGARGWGRVARLAVGTASLSLPGGFSIEVDPCVWDVTSGPSVDLREPMEGLTLTVSPVAGGRVIDVKASELPIGRLGRLLLEGQAAPDPGSVDGEAHWEEAASGSAGRWHFSALGAESTAEAHLSGNPGEARLEATLTLARLDLARLFGALGVERPAGAEALGSLAATVGATGLLADPGSIVVTQRLDFTPPSTLPKALTRLRGEFTHEVTASDGSRHTIDLSPGSPDFIARADVPPLFVVALLIAEDAAFFSHRGLDLRELPKALTTNFAQGSAARGASTITQQLAKNLFLSREKSLHRKLQELALAFLLESTLGKDRILEIYLNIIEWGPGLYGLRPAARHYFGKGPGELTPKETAFLVALIPGPVKYQRSFVDGTLTPGFGTLVTNLLAKLRSVDAISEEAYAGALEETLAFRRPPTDAAPADDPRDPG